MYTSNQVLCVVLCACITAIAAIHPLNNNSPVCGAVCDKKNTTLPVVNNLIGDNYCDPNLSIRDVLIEFYDALGGDNWYENDGWTVTSDYCSWEGIICNNGGTIQTIDLHNNNLIGDQIPPSLGCITTLKSLVLDNNFISGQIPNNFCNLRHIQYLTMPHNNLGGNIPACFSELTHLMHLYLHYNGFVGQLPDFSKYTNIKEIHVQGNCLTGNVPQWIPSHVIIDLNFTNNYFSGCIPSFYDNIIVDFHGNPAFCDQAYIPCFYTDEFFMCPPTSRHNVAGPFSYCGSTERPVYCLSFKD